MKAPFICYCFVVILVQTVSAQRNTQLFDKDWLFFKGDANGAEQPTFNDASWRKLDVPHDWSIEGPYDKDNPTKSGGGYLPAGIGYYRKSFTLGDNYKNKKVSVEFDGVMSNSDVWINGFHLGNRPYGYSSFSYDLTDHLNYGGKPNVLTVKADNWLQPASRYYRGAGIYRHVRLVATDPVHFDHWSLYVTTPAVTAQKATVLVQSKIVNQSAKAVDYMIETTIIDPSGKAVKSTQSKQKIAGGKTVDISQTIEVANPQLWGFNQPQLYKAITKIKDSKSAAIDDDATSFGIRAARFDATTGFWLNNKNIKLKGVCLHHDGGAVGAAVPLGVWKRRLARLKEVGANAIRTSHNPVDPGFLDLCDQMGFAVMDETFDTWTAGKPNGEKGYNLYFTDWWEKDTRDMVMRDRNHPSIVIYSVGNEIHDNLDGPEGFKKYKDQQDLIHSLDSTRPVTMALFRPGSSKVYTNGFAAMMDVVGQNYRENELVAAHEAHPEWKVIGTENGHTLAAWLPARDKPYMAGQFLWTGYDYLGEAVWPATTNGQGLFDRIGSWKATSLQRQSWWSDQPVVHIVRREENAGAGPFVANWTPTDFGTYDDGRVQVYSNCDEVELFLNGKSLGVKQKPADDAPRNWEVPFDKGTLKAIGKNKGKEVAAEELKTAGAPAKIILTIDQSLLSHSFDDVAFVTATIVDENGIACPNEDTKIRFSIEGPGVIEALDNGNINSHEIYKATEYPSYHGKVLAIIKAKATSGKIIIKANATGLSEGSVSVAVK